MTSTITLDGNPVTVVALPSTAAAAVIRGSNSQTSTTTSLTIALPSGTQAGDFALLFVSNGHPPSVPSGWTVLYSESVIIQEGYAASKTLTSGDISAGSVTVSSGAFNMIAQIVTFVGPTGGVRETDAATVAGGVVSQSQTTSGAVLSTDTGIFFSTSRTNSGGSISINPGTVLQSTSVSGTSFSVLASQAMAAGASTVNFSYVTTAAAFQVVVIVQGAPTGRPNPGMRSVEFNYTDAVAIARSPFTGQTQSKQWAGADVLSGTMTLPSRTQVQADAWICFLMQLRGMANAFQIGDPFKCKPAGNPAGSVPVVDMSITGTNLPGSQTLYTRGWPASTNGLLLQGDWIQVGYRLHRVLDIVNSDASGKAQLAVWPSLREFPTDGESVIYNNPVGLFRLGSNNRVSSTDFTRLSKVSFPILEYR